MFDAARICSHVCLFCHRLCYSLFCLFVCVKLCLGYFAVDDVDALSVLLFSRWGTCAHLGITCLGQFAYLCLSGCAFPANTPMIYQVRLVHRDVHDGIVGARIRGAQEAVFPIILFLDSHAEVGRSLCLSRHECVCLSVCKGSVCHAMPGTAPESTSLCDSVLAYLEPPLSTDHIDLFA